MRHLVTKPFFLFWLVFYQWPVVALLTRRWRPRFVPNSRLHQYQRYSTTQKHSGSFVSRNLPIDPTKQQRPTVPRTVVANETRLGRPRPTVAATDHTYPTDLRPYKTRVSRLLEQKDYPAAFAILRQLLVAGPPKSSRLEISSSHWSAAVDEMVQLFTALAFVPTTVDRGEFVLLAINVIQLQCSSQLAPPYAMVPKHTLLQALKALTTLATQQHFITDASKRKRYTDLAYSVLQRLLTGRHVRTRQRHLHEADFTRVLSAYVTNQRLPDAERLLRLQQRTRDAPPVSAVSYAILVKGYGAQRDLARVEQITQRLVEQNVRPDRILVNAVMDAYINCHAVDRAARVFRALRQPNQTTLAWLAPPCPRPNVRSYNTLLKGFAITRRLTEAHALVRDMIAHGYGDAVTVNTFVHAAVQSQQLQLAREFLDNHTMVWSTSPSQQEHPNVAAYTELLDGYAKNQQLDQATDVLRIMQQRGVAPNEITYTCLLAGFAREKKLRPARQTLEWMKARGMKVNCVTYNAFLAGLVAPAGRGTRREPEAYQDVEIVSEYVDEALGVLREMISSGVHPNDVTVSTIVRALGQTRPPRLSEAKVLLDQLECQNLISVATSSMIATALLQTCGRAQDMQSAVAAFRKLVSPDLVAINAFLDACCRCHRSASAFRTFDFYFRRKKVLPPDVVSYSILISSLYKNNKVESVTQIQSLYDEMIMTGLLPDKPLIDMILKAAISMGRNNSLSLPHVRFLARVLRDAEQLIWEDGQLERRKRAVQLCIKSSTIRKRDVAVLLKQFSINENDVNDNDDDDQDDLFRRKGWNKVDSRFRVLGSSPFIDSSVSSIWKDQPRKQSVDKFFESKGWNNFDSSFRLI